MIARYPLPAAALPRRVTSFGEGAASTVVIYSAFGEKKICEKRVRVNATVSAEVADWNRERPQRMWDPPRRLLATIRRYQTLRERRGVWPRMELRWQVICHRFWSAITGADIPLNAQIGGGLLIPHPNGIVIHPGVRIGVNCLIFQQVTLGHGRGGHPTIGNHVDIGAGAKILGGVTIGANALIGANAVVLCDVPPGKTAVGIPARVVVGRGAQAAVIDWPLEQERPS